METCSNMTWNYWGIDLKLSILTATHNDDRFIPDCAKSILSQAYPDFEWIVVDDCSTDGTFDFLSSIKDPRLRLFRNNEQLFCSSTYARALKEATGEVCAVVDGDDALPPKAVKTIMKLYKKHRQLGYIYTQHWWCDMGLNKKRKGLSSLPGNMSFTKISLKKRKHCFSHWRTFKRHLSEQVTLFPEGLKYSVDKNLGFVLERVAYGGYCPEPLYLYRYYKGNMSLVHAKEQKKSWRELAENFERMKSRTFPVVKVG